MRASRLAAAALAAALAATLAGCGADQNIDTAKTETEIKRTFERQTGDRARSVRCPEEVKVEMGSRFRCVAVASDGSRVPIRVTQLDSDGSLRWRVVGGGD